MIGLPRSATASEPIAPIPTPTVLRPSLRSLGEIVDYYGRSRWCRRRGCSRDGDCEHSRVQRRLGLGPLGVGSDGGHRARGVEEGGSSAPRGGVPGGVAATAATYATIPSTFKASMVDYNQQLQDLSTRPNWFGHSAVHFLQ